MVLNETCLVSVIIPTYNGASRIQHCLESLQAYAPAFLEILVVDDGSSDDIEGTVSRFPRVRLLKQANAGPAAARNRGAVEAGGQIILFTDDDCVPMSTWFESMLAPFQDPEVIGAKGVYRTRQKRLVARFVQIEYEDKYRIMEPLSEIDFIDTYSAAYRRDRFLEMDGYDTSFPVACAEDVELSYRMSARNWKMKFAPAAVVYHTHPDTLSRYLSKKYKFAFWRVLAVRKNPSKSVKDSHTPQMMKLQLLFAPALLTSLVFDLLARPAISVSALTVGAFFISTLPFAVRALKKDTIVGLCCPVLLAARAGAQFLGVTGGFIYAARNANKISSAKRISSNEISSLHSLYLLHLSCLLSSERKMVEGLQVVADCSSGLELKEALVAHLDETKVHSMRISQMIEEVGPQKEESSDELIAGVVDSAHRTARELTKGPLRDAALLLLCRRMKHCEIALYSTASEWAMALSRPSHAEILTKILHEKIAAERVLSWISQQTLPGSLAA